MTEHQSLQLEFERHGFLGVVLLTEDQHVAFAVGEHEGLDRLRFALVVAEVHGLRIFLVHQNEVAILFGDQTVEGAFGDEGVVSRVVTLGENIVELVINRPVDLHIQIQDEELLLLDGSD